MYPYNEDGRNNNNDGNDNDKKYEGHCIRLSVGETGGRSPCI